MVAALAPPQIGHNHPPGPVEAETPAGVAKEVQDASRAISREVAKRRPDVAEVARRTTVLAGAARRLRAAGTAAASFGKQVTAKVKDKAAEAFDPYPFQLLCMIVSMEGVLLSTFVLIKQNRMSARADERNQLGLQVNLLAEEEVTKVLQMLERISAQLVAQPPPPGAVPPGVLQHLAAEARDLAALCYEVPAAAPPTRCSMAAPGPRAGGKRAGVPEGGGGRGAAPVPPAPTAGRGITAWRRHGPNSIR